jgi:hypothetical protein
VIEEFLGNISKSSVKSWPGIGFCSHADFRAFTTERNVSLYFYHKKSPGRARIEGHTVRKNYLILLVG